MTSSYLCVLRVIQLLKVINLFHFHHSFRILLFIFWSSVYLDFIFVYGMESYHLFVQMNLPFIEWAILSPMTSTAIPYKKFLYLLSSILVLFPLIYLLIKNTNCLDTNFKYVMLSGRLCLLFCFSLVSAICGPLYSHPNFKSVCEILKI